MMKALVATLVVLAVALGLFAWKRSNEPQGPAYATPAATSTSNALIRVAEPLPNALVSSPLEISGTARGNWFFEASFPVKILDAEGRELGAHYAEAQGEWMTTEFVPFRSTLRFATSTTPTGTLVLEKDNPSGLPENAAEVRVPVRFTSYASKTPIQDVVRALLAEWNLPGVTLDAASLKNGVLTLTFSDPQYQTSGGSARVSAMRERIEAAVRPFGVSSVIYRPVGVFEP